MEFVEALWMFFSTCVPLRRKPLQGLREVEGGLTHFFVAVGFFNQHNFRSTLFHLVHSNSFKNTQTMVVSK